MFSEINTIWEDPEKYKEIVGEFSDVAVEELDQFSSSNTDYVWNEGLARAAWHYLNEKGACGTNGDVYGFGFRSLLSSLYAYTYEQLEYELISSPYFINPENFTESATDGLLFILS